MASPNKTNLKIEIMNKNELRIGNFLMYDKKLIYISEITKAGIGMYDGYGLDKNSPIECLKPIKLTEKWLLDFGFKRQPWGLVKGGLLFQDKNLKCEELTIEIGNGFRTNLLYVHELQNLYFALTGNELKRVDGF